MSVNKFKDGELVKVSGSLASASSVSYTDETGKLDVTNVKDAIDKLTSKKVGKNRILNTLSEVIASTNNEDVAGASAVREVDYKIYDEYLNIYDGLYGMFYRKRFTTPSFSYNGYSTHHVDVYVNVTGYTPIGIVAWANGATWDFFCYNAEIKSNQYGYYVDLRFQSDSTVSFSGAIFHFDVLYIKNGFGFY